MKKKLISPEILFEVTDVFGKKIRTTKDYWRYIKEKKHSDLEYGVTEITETLERPDVVFESVKDLSIALYRKRFRVQDVLMVVAKHLNGNGFLVTVYQTTKSYTKGVKLWPK